MISQRDKGSLKKTTWEQSRSPTGVQQLLIYWVLTHDAFLPLWWLQNLSGPFWPPKYRRQRSPGWGTARAKIEVAESVGRVTWGKCEYRNSQWSLNIASISTLLSHLTLSSSPDGSCVSSYFPSRKQYNVLGKTQLKSKFCFPDSVKPRVPHL